MVMAKLTAYIDDMKALGIEEDLGIMVKSISTDAFGVTVTIAFGENTVDMRLEDFLRAAEVVDVFLGRWYRAQQRQYRRKLWFFRLGRRLGFKMKRVGGWRGKDWRGAEAREMDKKEAKKRGG